MSREKQIEEISRTLCGEKEHDCSVCDSCDLCEFWHEASILYNAGYRKSSDVAAEIFAEIERAVVSNFPHKIFPIGGERDFTYGVNLGTRTAIYEVLKTIAEIKKRKYTESEGKK